MAIATGLFGIFQLTETAIDLHVSSGIGAYLLGDQLNSDGSLFVRYAGRSDSDLNKRLKDWVGSYNHFLYGYYSTIADAYQAECHFYHTFGGADGRLDNSVHPAKPFFVSGSCPVCGA
jgi:hypothetical protein